MRMAVASSLTSIPSASLWCTPQHLEVNYNPPLAWHPTVSFPVLQYVANTTGSVDSTLVEELDPLADNCTVKTCKIFRECRVDCSLESRDLDPLASSDLFYGEHKDISNSRLLVHSTGNYSRTYQELKFEMPLTGVFHCIRTPRSFPFPSDFGPRGVGRGGPAIALLYHKFDFGEANKSRHTLREPSRTHNERGDHSSSHPVYPLVLLYMHCMLCCSVCLLLSAGRNSFNPLTIMEGCIMLLSRPFFSIQSDAGLRNHPP